MIVRHKLSGGAPPFKYAPLEEETPTCESSTANAYLEDGRLGCKTAAAMRPAMVEGRLLFIRVRFRTIPSTTGHRAKLLSPVRVWEPGKRSASRGLVAPCLRALLPHVLDRVTEPTWRRHVEDVMPSRAIRDREEFRYVATVSRLPH